jgi:serine/threonine protein kinase/tetratricopeptide (TPR) repeat protein
MPDRRPPSVEETVGPDPDDAEELPLRRGASVGRYVLLDQIGAGAMGVVFSAYDPELDRKLALKVLHPGSSSREAKATRNRLRREAQALARLTHPNVVSVHDVGTHGGRVFVAMEFVAGKTLRQWVADGFRRPPTVAEILEVFAAAGRGLAAAHKAGLVHRDFKPENVLLGEDGTVRVVDFGLARRSEDELLDGSSVDGSGALALDASESESLKITAERSLEMSLTRTGGMMGTPAYMAPEQHNGETATPRSDQFAFCVALWEALYGQRPFPGRDLPSLSLAVTTGRIADPPSEGPFANRVPAHVHRALLQGLSTEPSARFPSMEALVKALSHDPGRRRRRLGKIVVLNVIGASVVFGAGMWFADHFAGAETELAVCEPERELGGIWDAQRRATLAERFASSNAPFAAHAARELDRRLEAYTKQWLDTWGETCEAERTLGPSEALELQRECLEQRRRELIAFTEALVSVDGEAFDQRAEFAVAAAEGLSPISSCRDPTRLRSDSHHNPEQRERVAALQTRLSEAQALGNLGDPRTGLERAKQVLSEARELASQRMLIRALLAVADLEQRANENDSAVAHLREGYAIAEQYGEDWLRAEAAVAMIGRLGFDLQRPAEAAVWQYVAGSLLDRIGNPADLRGQWWYEVGTVHVRQSEFREAEQALDHALGQFEATYGADAREVERTLLHLGTVARERGDYDRAMAYHSRLLERRKAAYGPDHPEVAAAYGSLGNNAYFRGDYEDARDYYKEALRIVGECYGQDSPAYAPKLNNYAAVLERLGELDEAEAIHRQLLATNIARYGGRDVRVTTSYENLGMVLLSANRFAEAAEQFRTSLDIRTEHHGDDHTATATSKLNLGYALFRLGDRQQARMLYQQALATWTAKLGEDHPDLGLAHGNLGELDFAEGRLEAARTHYERALAITSAALGEDAADLGYYLTGLAQVELADGDSEQAIELCERALEVRNGTWLPPGDLGATQLTLSRALLERGREEDRTRAKDLAVLAIEDIRRGPDVGRLEEARAWLATLG